MCLGNVSVVGVASIEGNKKTVSNVLTVHDEHDALAYRGWNAVRSDAQVRAHLLPAHPGYI